MVKPIGNQSYHYEEYARQCLNLATQTPDRGVRLVLREMAGEWLRLLEGAPLNGGGFDGAGHSAHVDARS